MYDGFIYGLFSVMSMLRTSPVLTGAVSAVSEHCRGLHYLSKVTQITRSSGGSGALCFVTLGKTLVNADVCARSRLSINLI